MVLNDLIELGNTIVSFLKNFADIMLSPLSSGSLGFTDFLGLGALWDTVRLALVNAYGSDISLFILIVTVGMGFYIVATIVGWVLSFIPVI